MVRRRPLLSAAAMSHATLAWPQARPHGPCDAQPRAYHGPSDFHLWAPVGRTAHAGMYTETPASLACLAAHAAAAAAAPHSVLWTRASAGFQNARRAPASSEQTNRATALYHSYQQRILTHRIHSPRCDPWRHLSHSVCDHACRPRRPPTACDCACRSLITCVAPRPRMSTKNIPTLFDRPSTPPATGLSRLSCTTPPVWAHMHRSHRSLTTYVALRPSATVCLLAAVALALRPGSLAPVRPRPLLADRQREIASEYRPGPPRGGGAARPPVRGRAHNDQRERTSQRPPVPYWLVRVRCGGVVGWGVGCAGPSVCVSGEGSSIYPSPLSTVSGTGGGPRNRSLLRQIRPG